MKYLKIVLIFMLSFSAYICSYSQQNNSDSTLVKENHKKTNATPPYYYYSKLPAIGQYVHKLPANALMIASGSNISYYKGIFYQPAYNDFIIITAPIGIRISSLPYGYINIKIEDKTYFYYFGVFYELTIDGSYTVINAPLGAIVNSIPKGYKTLIIDNENYYLLNKTFYKEYINSHNKPSYIVSKNKSDESK